MSLVPQKLIVGLGNPGESYQATRHNAGVWLVNQLAHRYQEKFVKQKKLNAFIATVNHNWGRTLLAVPTVFMNESGRSVRAIQNYYKIPYPQIVVAHDELDFDSTQVKFKMAGGHGGHNGLRDIIQQLGSNEFNRIRIGIGHPRNNRLVRDYVLTTPTPTEKQQIQDSLERTLKLSDNLFQGNLEELMLQLHTQN